MADFIGKVVDQERVDEGELITIRMTGFGSHDGPLMTRAKARALAATTFGSKFARRSDTVNKRTTRTVKTDEVEDKFERMHGFMDVDKGESTAVRDESFLKGSVDNLRDKIKTFRKDGLFVEIRSVDEVKTERVVDNEKLEEIFGPLAQSVSTYRYKTLVTTNFSLS